jgi:hypothetical protein
LNGLRINVGCLPCGIGIPLDSGRGGRIGCSGGRLVRESESLIITGKIPHGPAAQNGSSAEIGRERLRVDVPDPHPTVVVGSVEIVLGNDHGPSCKPVIIHTAIKIIDGNIVYDNCSVSPVVVAIVGFAYCKRKPSDIGI